MDSLRLLYLSSNKFSGQIPDKFGKNKNLQDLYLDNNSFTGPIPEIPNDGTTLVKIRKLLSNPLKSLTMMLFLTTLAFLSFP